MVNANAAKEWREDWVHTDGLEQILEWPTHVVAASKPLEDSAVWTDFVEMQEATELYPDSPFLAMCLNEAKGNVRNFNIAAKVFQSGGSSFR